ncbi:L,D-transpeptidase [Luteimonas sp. 22616]|uniref:L,D-transpeptidase n=1 Tax=Luteimonas sp. 22616 TaxID=3453951 RepID=UPI003F82DBFB
MIQIKPRASISRQTFRQDVAIATNKDHLTLSSIFRYCLTLLFAIASVPSQSQESLQQLPDQGYIWTPQLSPQGPTTIVVSLQEQRAYVYRNGVRIGISKVSTGKPGYETPTGVFTILEKHREHYSNRYDNAPMPFMQRLTWDGVALHAGNVPAYPASHGCIRLPYAFSEILFGITARGMTVVVSDTAAAPAVVYPELFAVSGAMPAAPIAPMQAFLWVPDRSPAGPMTIVLSTHEREILVVRNAVEIGRAPVEVADGVLQGTRVYLLLRGAGPEASSVVPGRPALRWLAVSDGMPEAARPDLRRLVAAGQLRIDPGFAAQVYEALVPGTTLVVTDEPIRPPGPANLTILQGAQAAEKASARSP